jgi:predicted lipoprotein with Yx(FWY)xxD motif
MHVSNVAAKVAAAAAVALLAAGSALAMHDEVKVAKGKGGSYLTDAKGMALYVFKKDTPGKSVCAGECVAKWPLYYQEKVGVSGGAATPCSPPRPSSEPRRG